MLTPVLSHGRKAYLALDDLSGSLQNVSSYFRSADGLPGRVDRSPSGGFGEDAVRRQVMGKRDSGPIRLGGLLHNPSKVHGKTAKFLIDQYAPYRALLSGSFARSIAVERSDGFGVDDAEREVIGKIDSRLGLRGHFNAAAGGSDAVFRALRAQETPALCMLGLGGFAIGSLVELSQQGLTNYTFSSDHERANELSADFEGDDLPDLGVSLHDLVAETGVAPVNYTTVDETAATASGGVGHLHVYAFTGTSITIKIQHSTDGSTWADLISFTAATGATKQRLTVSGTVNRYVRAIVSAGTYSTCTFAVGFARRGFAYGTAGTYRHLVGLIGRTATTSFEFGPEGNASGARKWSGECRAEEVAVEFAHDQAISITASLGVTGAVTEGTF
jgi:hypothetical protein